LAVASGKCTPPIGVKHPGKNRNVEDNLSTKESGGKKSTILPKKRLQQKEILMMGSENAS